MSAYRVGERVVYFQPGVQAILASWSGKRTRHDLEGEEREVTVKSVESDGQNTYYDTEEGVYLIESEILRRAEA